MLCGDEALAQAASLFGNLQQLPRKGPGHPALEVGLGQMDPQSPASLSPSGIP